MYGLTRPDLEIRRLSQDIEAKSGELESIKHLLTKFPDLMVFRPDGKDERIYCSSTVNPIVDEFAVKVDVDACQAIDAWTYTTVDDIKVYSNPPYFTVGANNLNGFGVRPNPGWEDELESNNLPLSMVRKIRNHLKGCPPIDYV